jgi:hypothetical protein
MFLIFVKLIFVLYVVQFQDQKESTHACRLGTRGSIPWWSKVNPFLLMNKIVDRENKDGPCVYSFKSKHLLSIV